MKIRNDYVSNSSSSSFIIGNHEMFDHFLVTKEDIKEALIEAYGREAYEKRAAENKDFSLNHQEWNAKSIKYNDFGPFYVYDLEDEDDRNQAIDMWGDLLKGWTSTNTKLVRGEKPEDDHIELGSNEGKYNKVIKGIADIYNLSEWELMDWDFDDPTFIPKKFIRESEKNPETGLYGHYEPLPKEIVDFLRKLHHDSGLMTNLDVLKAECSKFFVHADDNEIPTCTPRDEWDDEKHEYRSKEYETDGYSYDRVCEIVYNYLVKKGRINPTQEDFLKEMEIDPKYLSDYDIKNGEIYNFMNGKNLSWRDLRYASLTWCMHEG